MSRRIHHFCHLNELYSFRKVVKVFVSTPSSRPPRLRISINSTLI